MKGIKLCGECANYDWKKHRCRIGCNDDSDPQASFYGDCPLPDVEPVQSWISVDERLPDKMRKVLAYRGEFRGGMMNVYTHLENGNWEDDYGYRSSTEYEGITHWMPLPEPPKGE